MGKKQLAVRATVNILDWKLVLKMELSVGCLQQPTAVTLTQKPAAGEHGHTHWRKPSDFNVQIVEVQLLLVPLSEEPPNVHSLSVWCTLYTKLESIVKIVSLKQIGQQLIWDRKCYLYQSPGIYLFLIYFKDRESLQRKLLISRNIFYTCQNVIILSRV